MEKIKLQISGRRIQVTECPDAITSGSTGLQAELAFDSLWDDLNKIVVFKAGEKTVAIELEEATVTVPWEVLEKPNQWLCVGVYGIDGEGKVIVPTLWAQVAMVHNGTDPQGDPAMDPTLPVWQDLKNAVETGEAARKAHSDSKNNPHETTYEQVGAAPAGYGLGERFAATQNWNHGYYNAFVRGNTNSPDGAIWYGIVCKNGSTDSATTEIAFSASSGNSVCEVKRTRSAGGTWGAWEYVNPSMEPGVEYRTTERWMGKPVYTKLLNCGETSACKSVELEDQLYIIRTEGCILDAEDVPVCPLPNGQLAWLETRGELGVVTLCCNEENYCHEHTFCIRLWYVK